MIDKSTCDGLLARSTTGWQCVSVVAGVSGRRRDLTTVTHCFSSLLLTYTSQRIVRSWWECFHHQLVWRQCCLDLVYLALVHWFLTVLLVYPIEHIMPAVFGLIFCSFYCLCAYTYVSICVLFFMFLCAYAWNKRIHSFIHSFVHSFIHTSFISVNDFQ